MLKHLFLMKVQNSFPSFFSAKQMKNQGVPNRILFINLIPYKYTHKKDYFFYIYIQRID